MNWFFCAGLTGLVISCVWPVLFPERTSLTVHHVVPVKGWMYVCRLAAKNVEKTVNISLLHISRYEIKNSNVLKTSITRYTCSARLILNPNIWTKSFCFERIFREARLLTCKPSFKPNLNSCDCYGFLPILFTNQQESPFGCGPGWWSCINVKPFYYKTRLLSWQECLDWKRNNSYVTFI